MQTRSLRLDTQTWDLMLDGAGNLAVTDNPYAVAQDVACACSTFLGNAGTTPHWAFPTTHASWVSGRGRSLSTPKCSRKR